MSDVRWKPIELMPNILKDRRQVLLSDGSEHCICRWDPRRKVWDTGFASEIDGDPIEFHGATHFAGVAQP